MIRKASRNSLLGQFFVEATGGGERRFMITIYINQFHAYQPSQCRRVNSLIRKQKDTMVCSSCCTLCTPQYCSTEQNLHYASSISINIYNTIWKNMERPLFLPNFPSITLCNFVASTFSRVVPPISSTFPRSSKASGYFLRRCNPLRPRGWDQRSGWGSRKRGHHINSPLNKYFIVPLFPKQCVTLRGSYGKGKAS